MALLARAGRLSRQGTGFEVILDRVENLAQVLNRYDIASLYYRPESMRLEIEIVSARI